MNDYALSLVAVLVALCGQSVACGLSTEFFLRPDLNRNARRTWMALASASALLALQQGYALELALRTGLYDLRQAVLAACVGLLLGLAVYGFRRQA